mmetsp:Transcript_18408/g.42360  ORF Transcript_18408/g.42360 Transcript_18408/m.42360 type:complete len:385 (-) Transcript_18408:361-1515(-)
MGGKRRPQSKEAVAAPSLDWQASDAPGKRRRKRGVSWLLWLLGPLLAGGAVLFLGAKEPPAHMKPQEAETPAVKVDEGTDKMKPPPVDLHNTSECAAWAADGQCAANGAFMLTRCELSCLKLELVKQAYERRCPKPENYTPTLAPGQMPRTFARIMSHFPELEPEMISEDPPVILFHKFLSDAEAEAFIKHGAGRYSKSLGVGLDKDGKMADVPTEIRTSSHGWCQHQACLDDPEVQRVTARVADVTQTPTENAEFAQLVYYHACDDESDNNKCAFYRRHSDYIAGDQYRLQGVRIYTLFTYLNDVPEGGATRFTDLPNGPVTFQPVKGKAVLWPSVLADEPHTVDPRTHHEALPVTKGEKYGANFWIHQYNFRNTHAKGCTAG